MGCLEWLLICDVLAAEQYDTKPVAQMLHPCAFRRPLRVLTRVRVCPWCHRADFGGESDATNTTQTRIGSIYRRARIALFARQIFERQTASHIPLSGYLF